jgi:TRAP-type C4-dicarboxylate transport system substrate-binding protein
MGAAALVTGIGDYYSSLEKNLADTILAHWPIMHEFKLTELTPGHIMLSETNDYAGMGNSMQGWLVNKAVWDSIPPEYQQVIREELDWSADATAYDNDNQIKVAIEFAKGLGHTINRLTPEEAQQWYDLAIVNRDTWAKTSGLPTEEANALWDKFQSAVKNKDL